MPSLSEWILLIVVALSVNWLMRRFGKKENGPKTSRGPTFAVVEPSEANSASYPYVYIGADGEARELHQGERDFLETQFHPGDGARPYVKGRYAALDGWGSMAGFLKRSKVPAGKMISGPPSEDPSKPLTKEDQLEFLRSKGLVVTENPDGSFTAKKPNH